MNAPAPRPIYEVQIAEARNAFEAIAQADGNLVSYARESGYALQLFAGSEQLPLCHPDSIRNAIINVASVGLTLNPAMKFAYLVPRKGKCCLDISYIGLVKIATDSGGVLAVAAVPVRARDKFTYLDPFTPPKHVFHPFDSEEKRGDIVGVYTLAKLASGITQVDCLSREEIEKIKNVSRAKSGPWVEWFVEMVKKTGIKRASKLWPRTERMAAAEAILNEHEGIPFTPDEEGEGGTAAPKATAANDAPPPGGRVSKAQAKMKQGAQRRPTTVEGEAHRVDGGGGSTKPVPTREDALTFIAQAGDVPTLAKYMNALPTELSATLGKEFSARVRELKPAA